jgi:hypothetical protein
MTVVSFSKPSPAAASTADLNNSLGRLIKEKSAETESGKCHETPPFSSPKTRTRKRLNSVSKKNTPSSKRFRLTIAVPADPPVITDTASCGEAQARKPRPSDWHAVDYSEAKSPLAGESPEPPGTPLKSPAKLWSVVRTTESPLGEIKMRLNRKKKPEQRTPLVVNRISRRMTNDLGLTPEVLNQLMLESPSPKKKAARMEKENRSDAHDTSVTSETSSLATPTSKSSMAARVLLRKIDANHVAASVDRKLKFSPLSTSGLFALTTSPIVDKKGDAAIRPKHRKVNKRLYTDDDDAGGGDGDELGHFL